MSAVNQTIQSPETTHQNDYMPIVDLIYQACENFELWPQLLSQLTESQQDLSQQPLFAQQQITEFLSKHFAQAMEISKNISESEQQNHLSDHILEHLPVGVCYLDDDGQLLYANQQAEAALESSVFQLKEGKLCIGDAPFLSADKQPTSKTPMARISLHDDEKITAYRMAVEGFAGRKLTAVLLIDNQSSAALSQERASSMYSLSDTEQKILTQLVDGKTVEFIATLLRRSLNTIKHHIKNIYLKMGVQKRTQLVRKISSTFYVPGARTLSSGIKRETPAHTHFFYKGDFRLAYASYGPEHGTPVVFMHCYLGDALEVPADISCLEKLNVRLLIPERPGFGYTDADSKHTYESWSLLLQDWLAELEIDRFRLMAYSSGVPFGIQLALDVQDRIDCFSIVAAFPNVKAIENVTASSSGTRSILRICSSSPSLIKPLLTAMLLNSAETFLYKTLINGKRPFCAPERDKAWLAQPEVAATYLEQLKRCKRQGAKGAIGEFQLVSKPWAFDFDKICCPTQIWHGTDDIIATMANYDYLISNLPNAEVHLIEEETHYLYYRLFGEVVEALLGS